LFWLVSLKIGQSNRFGGQRPRSHSFVERDGRDGRAALAGHWLRNDTVEMCTKCRMNKNKPDYFMLAGVLERCMKRLGVRDCDPYDWEKLAEAPQSVTTSSSSAAVPSKPQQRIITNPGTANVTTDNLGEDPLAASIGLNNQENMHPGDMAVAASAALPPALDRRSPLQTA
jgi:hypothetical protein